MRTLGLHSGPRTDRPGEEAIVDPAYGFGGHLGREFQGAAYRNHRLKEGHGILVGMSPQPHELITPTIRTESHKARSFGLSLRVVLAMGK